MSVNIHGKEYRTVAARVNEIHKEFPGRVEINTDIIEHYRPEGKAAEVTFKATVITINPPAEGTNNPLASSYTGHAHEVQDLSVPTKGKKPKVNATSYLENSETSAIGRALAAAGYAGTEFASANEMNTALRQELEMEIDDLKKRLGKGIRMYKSLAKELKRVQSKERDTPPPDPYSHFDGDPQPGEE